MQTTSKPNGFTLVELAIVITIIGILIGGVLKGQQLIEQARIAGTIQQMRDYKSAVLIFQTKYDALPGDMPDADKRIVGCSNCTATVFPRGGNVGDGDVGGTDDARWTYTQNVLGSETTLFWLQLYKADMISGLSDAAVNGGPIAWGQTHPVAKIGKGANGFSIGDSAGAEHNSWSGNKGPYGTVLILHENTPDSSIGGRAISNVAAASMDRKLDDGQPDTGDFRGVGSHGCGNQDDASNAPDAEYHETLAGNKCSIAYVIAL